MADRNVLANVLEQARQPHTARHLLLLAEKQPVDVTYDCLARVAARLLGQHVHLDLVGHVPDAGLRLYAGPALVLEHAVALAAGALAAHAADDHVPVLLQQLVAPVPHLVRVVLEVLAVAQASGNLRAVNLVVLHVALERLGVGNVLHGLVELLHHGDA